MIIEIRTKEKYAACERDGFAGRMAHAGLKIKGARLARLYKVEGDFTAAEFRRLGGELLADPVTETWAKAPARTDLKGWRVEVWLKDSVTDVVGESVEGAVEDVLGKKPESVRFGRAWCVAGVTEAELRRAVAGTLVNETVNKFSVERI